jgi:uncharacterized protein YecE (DUF72 family)
LEVYVGCCGLTKSMKKYFEIYPLLETQNTFYRIVRPETARRWRELAHPDFVFTVKAFQGITHPASSPTWRRSNIKPTPAHGRFQLTSAVFDSWQRTKTICEELQAPVTIIQAPATFTDAEQNVKSVEEFFRSIDRGGLIIGFEPRGWRQESIAEVCDKVGVTHVTDPFVSNPVSLGGTGVAYFRLHGSPPGKKMYYYTYSDGELKTLADRLTTLGASRVFVLFNNITREIDAKRFLKLIKA